MFKKILLTSILVASLATSCFASDKLTSEPKLYTFRLGKAVVGQDWIPATLMVRLYTRSVLLDWIPVVRSCGLTVGTSLDHPDKTGWFFGASYELNPIVDFSYGVCYVEKKNCLTSESYFGVSLDAEVFNKVIDYLQNLVK
ncbi:TPA: hypothetical protein DCX15_00960 [bacterium]|nr:hypothetical protein [bacterium]